MIPENEPFVESKHSPEAIVKAFFDKGRVPDFDPFFPTFAKQVTTQVAEARPSFDLVEMYRMMQLMNDNRYDQEIRLIEALEAMGAIITTSPLLPDNRIVVTMPERYERAREERDRRRARKQQVIDTAALAPLPPFIVNPDNPCTEMEA